jgi:hypothetical protein
LDGSNYKLLELWQTEWLFVIIYVL